MIATEGISRCQRIYDGLLSRLNIGETATYRDISEALEEPFTDAARTALTQAINRMEKERRLTMHCLRGVGYVVSQPRQVIETMEKRTTKAARQLHLGARTGDRVDISSLPANEQLEHRQMVKSLRALKAELQRVKRRVGVVEEKVGEHGTTIEDLVSRIAALENKPE